MVQGATDRAVSSRAQEEVWDGWGWNRDAAQLLCAWIAGQGDAI